MKKQSYRKSLILIVVTAVVLTAAQVYFTLQNYQVNKQRFIRDIQQALDVSIENYFAGRARNSIYVLGEGNGSFDTLINGKRAFGYATKVQNADSLIKVVVDSQSAHNLKFNQVWTGSRNSHPSNLDSVFRINNERSLKRLKITTRDSDRVKELHFLTQKVMFSISEELLNLGEVYSELEKQLKGKNLVVDFALTQRYREGKKVSIGSVNNSNYLSVDATSVFVDDLSSVTMDFENATLIILKNGIGDLVLSVLLIGLVVGTLLHLYRTINEQKQLAAIKDDLISNITHEFKTPIATIFSALEGVTSFNETNDEEKTRRYLALSNDQLHKLNDMVEKMLETAIIDQGKLTLNTEEVEVKDLTMAIVKRFQMVETEKTISFDSTMSGMVGTLDRFHIENTLSNLIDNAIKYGGNEIAIRLFEEHDKLVWEVEDNGGNIPSTQRNKIFDKLYRVPTGNKHDVKGFGIGLYYARTIAELHGGQLTLDVSNERTLFRLTL